MEAPGSSALAARSRAVAAAAAVLWRSLRLLLADLYRASPRLRLALLSSALAWVLAKALRVLINRNWLRGQQELDSTRRLRPRRAESTVISLRDSDEDLESLASEEALAAAGSPAAGSPAAANGGARGLRHYSSQLLLADTYGLSPDDPRATLLDCEALAALDGEQLRFLLARAKVVRFEADESVFERGAPRDAFLLVHSGQVRVSLQEFSAERPGGDYALGPGDSVVGLLFVLASIGTGSSRAIATSSVHCSSARAGSKGAEVVALPTAALDDAFEQFPEAMSHLAQLLCARLSTVVLGTLAKYFGLGEFLASEIQPAVTSTPEHALTSMPPADIFAQALGIEAEDPSLSALVTLSQATTIIMEAGECIHALCRASHLLVLVDGELVAEVASELVAKDAEDDNRSHCASSPSTTISVPVGGMVSLLSVFVDKALPLVYRCKSRCRFAALPRESAQQLLGLCPKVCCLRILQILTGQLADWLHRVDAALSWIRIEGGRSLYRKGDSMKGFFVVLSGKLIVLDDDLQGESERTPESSSGHRKFRLVDSLPRGRLCGELDCLRANAKYSFSVLARRDTEVCRVSPSLLQLMASDFPRSVLHFSTRLAEEGRSGRQVDIRHDGVLQKVSTIAVLPTDKSVDVGRVCVSLVKSLKKLGTALHVSPNSDLAALRWGIELHGGEDVKARSLARSHLSRLLAELEEGYDWLVYEAEASVSDWTRRCIRQADLMVIVVPFDAQNDRTCSDKAALSPVELYADRVVRDGLDAERVLLLLHAAPTESQDQDGRFGRLKKQFSRSISMNAIPVSGPAATFDDVADLRQPGLRGLVAHLGNVGFFNAGRSRRYSTRYYLAQRPWAKRWFHARSSMPGDWDRCTRLLVGQGVAICLGGGGARGNIHFGVIRAMEELGIPIDAVSGTSFGALAGALYATTAAQPAGSLMRLVEKVMGRTFSNSRMLMDLTFPRTAIFTGTYLNRVLQKTFARRRCEDMIVPFVCTSTDIMNFEAKSHREGPLWRMIRASMSLVGFVPPLPHKELRQDGDGGVKVCSGLLVDGGYTNNYPVEQLRELGARVVVCVKVCPDFDPVSSDYGDRVFGLSVALLRLLRIGWRWYVGPDPPPQAEIQERLMFLPDSMKGGAGAGADVLLSPPIAGYGLLDFSRFRELEQIGYDDARPRLREWLEAQGASSATGSSAAAAAAHVRSILAADGASEGEGSAASPDARQVSGTRQGNAHACAGSLRKSESAPVGRLPAA
eukprot:TRINITY_DN11903_c0_g1_i1.p1 TRINITY_DN11903_c0_g1~~TRINITY_DN11903_c0_g1_i1.p1  ORF type:complete len:1293 (-),score=172.05 TRINITY_DN11903_c0_g1_i1:373-4110(-)